MPIIIKTPAQIEGIRKSCQLAARALDFVQPYVVPGVTTEYLDSLIANFTAENGALSAPLHYKGYPKSCCISLNEVICHGIPGPRILKEGDIVNIDVTTILNGFFGDTSRMFAVGEISKDAEKLLSVARSCLDIGIAQVHPGSHLSNIGYAITEYATEHGCSVVFEFCAHGTGLAFHEPPTICHREFKRGRGPQLKPGMIFTVEPMINLGAADAIVDTSDGWTALTKDGSLSAQYEHTVLVATNGVEILTQ